MNILTTIPFLKAKSPRQVISDSWKDREAIFTSDVNLFCWKRPVDRAISGYLEELLRLDKAPEPIQFQSNTEDLDGFVAEARLKWECVPLEGADLFWEDVTGLARDFLSFSGTNPGVVHLKMIDNDACTKFHTDGYSLRLFTTYFGKGTEWLPESATNRKGLGKTNEQIVKNPSQIRQMDSFEVGILKGEIPGSVPSARGIVHRSPEIASTRKRRIILRVDL